METRSSLIGDVGEAVVATRRKISTIDEGFDRILDIVGSRGRYQFRILYFMMVPICFFCLGYNICQHLFQFVVPEHWCYVPGRENTSLTLEEWKNLTIPREANEEKYSSCSRYKVTWKYGSNWTYDISNQTQECLDRWNFDRNQFWETVATSYNWVCNKESYSTNLLTINVVGNIVGTFGFPVIADRIGRRPTILMIVANHIICTLAFTWVSSYPLQMVFRFLRGFTEYSIYLLPCATVLEITHPDDRPRTNTIMWISWTFGMCTTALVAWVMPHWQYLALSTLPTGVLGFLFWKIYPESPRWLLSKNRLSECVDILINIGKTNGNKSLDKERLMEMLQVLSNQEEEKVSFLRAFKYPKLRMRSIAILVTNFCAYMVYGATFFEIDVLPENQFLSHFLLSASEFPSELVGWGLLHYLGRRMACYISVATVAISSITTVFFTSYTWTKMVLVTLIKCISTTVLFCIHVSVGEVFPTPIRSSAYGIITVGGMVGMSVAPPLINSGFGPAFKYWVMFGCSIIGLIASLAIPETIGLSLPQTFKEAEEIGIGRPLTTFIHHWNHHKYTPSKKKQSQKALLR